MELDFESLTKVINQWREQQEEAILPRDFKLPHINDDDGDD